METQADYEESALKQRVKLVPGSYQKDESSSIVRISYKEYYTSDIVQGRIVGAQMGGLTMAVIVSPLVTYAFFPVGLICVGLIAIGVIVGAIIGDIIGSKNHYNRVKYFDSLGGDYLGEKLSEASKSLAMKAFDQFIKGKYDEAKAYFEAANKHEQKEEYMKNIEACVMAKEATNLMNQNKTSEAQQKIEDIEKFSKSNNLHSLIIDHIDESKDKIIALQQAKINNEVHQSEERRRLLEMRLEEKESEREEKRQEEQRLMLIKLRLYEESVKEAEETVKLGAEAWNNGSELEDDGNDTEAKIKYQESLEYFKQARDILPDNSDLTDIYSLMSLKLENKIFFIEGIEAAKRGNSYDEDDEESLESYEKALQNFSIAKEKFEEGFRRTNDERFKQPLSLVDERILTVKNKLELLKTSSFNLGNNTATVNRENERKTDTDKTINQMDYGMSKKTFSFE